MTMPIVSIKFSDIPGDNEDIYRICYSLEELGYAADVVKIFNRISGFSKRQVRVLSHQIEFFVKFGQTLDEERLERLLKDMEQVTETSLSDSSDSSNELAPSVSTYPFPSDILDTKQQ